MLSHQGKQPGERDAAKTLLFISQLQFQKKSKEFINDAIPGRSALIKSVILHPQLGGKKKGNGIKIIMEEQLGKHKRGKKAEQHEI